MQQHRSLFESVRKRTGMFFQQETYAVVAAFLFGYDAACEGGVLAGFREWLVVRLGGGANLSWTALVLHVAFPDAPSPQDVVSVEPATERHAIDTLFELLEEFDSVRRKPDGLKDIFIAYEGWTLKSFGKAP
jgi:hypothetical protein